MRSRVDWLECEGGHIVVALFIFVVGVLLTLAHNDLGKEITVGALASLWTVIRTRNTTRGK